MDQELGQMIVVSSYLSDSKIKNAGVGLFSSKTILRGMPVVSPEPSSYETFSADEVQNSPEAFKNFLRTYANLRSDGTWILAKDNEKFMNHSRRPNIDELGFAARDIFSGDELTCDYRKTDNFVLQNPPEWL